MAKTPYDLCLEKIYKLGRFGIKLELDTILNILSQLNTPQNNYNMVHVAGTNGKGSTANCIASILSAAGFKTGVYTSPHLVRFNERICVNGQEISDAGVVRAYAAVSAGDNGSFFRNRHGHGLFPFCRKKGGMGGH